MAQSKETVPSPCYNLQTLTSQKANATPMSDLFSFQVNLLKAIHFPLFLIHTLGEVFVTMEALVAPGLSRGKDVAAGTGPLGFVARRTFPFHLENVDT